MANENERKGFFDKIKGKAEKVYGEITDNERMKDKGEAHKREGDIEDLKGKVARTTDDAKDTASHAKDAVENELHRH